MNRTLKTIGTTFTRRSEMSKVIMLGAGLAMGLVLVAKVYFEQSYNSYVPHIDRVYRVEETYAANNDELKQHPRTPGAIAPGIKEYSPAVEIATRYTEGGNDIDIKFADTHNNLSDRNYQCKTLIFADSCLFSIFARNMVVGNAQQTLAKPQYALLSLSYANMVAQGEGCSAIDLVGRTIAVAMSSETRITIGGIYEDFPMNSGLRNVGIVASLSTLGKFSWDGTQNWVGNDRYSSYVRLFPTANADDIKGAIDRMVQERLPTEELEKAGVKLSFVLAPLTKEHTSKAQVKTTISILSLLALLVILTSTLNYVLISISAMVRRAKIVAVHKCYGASRGNIQGMVWQEALTHLTIALLIAILVLAAFQNTVSQIIGTQVVELISPQSIALLVGVCMAVLLISAGLPGTVYAKIPVASAFRRYRESNRRWKHALLFVEFTATTLFVAVLLVVVLQYNYMMNFYTGYNHKQMAYINLAKIPLERRLTVMEEMQQHPFVEQTCLCTNPPFYGASGNNISLPNSDRELFNIADMYSVGEGYFKMLEVPIIDGRNFNEESQPTPEVMVSRSFVERMKTMQDWSDGAIGKVIYVSEHSGGTNPKGYTICGVYEDYTIGSAQWFDRRPSVQFFYKGEAPHFANGMSCLLIKLNTMSGKNIKTLQDRANALLGSNSSEVKTFAQEFSEQFEESRTLRKSVLIAGLVVLIISAIGLMGYVHDETNRRRSEMAIRKINGATLWELIRLFLRNTLIMSVLAATTGATAAYFVADQLLQLYSKHIALSWWIFAVPALVVVVLANALVVMLVLKAAQANPTKNLANE